MQGARFKMQDVLYYSTPIGILFIKVVSCSCVFHFFFNPKFEM